MIFPPSQMVPTAIVMVGAVAAGAAAEEDSMRDFPIAGEPGSLLYLDSDSWALSGSDGGASLQGVRVPSDVLTELEKAQVIGDPWFENNFRNASAWDRDWTYSLQFDDVWAGHGTRLLVFDGVKMGATVSLNGEAVGIATNQFLRYVFPVSHLLQPTANNLSVIFHRDIDTHGRFMGCSGGW